jgi:hypothetical protein
VEPEGPGQVVQQVQPVPRVLTDLQGQQELPGVRVRQDPLDQRVQREVRVQVVQRVQRELPEVQEHQVRPDQQEPRVVRG